MRLRLLTAVLVFAAACRTPAAGRAPSPHVRRSAVALAEGRVPSPEELRRDLTELEALRDSAQGARREALERLREAFEQLTVEAAPEAPAAEFHSFVQLVRDLARLDGADFELQAAVASAFLSFPFAAEDLGVDPEPFREEALARVRELVRGFPNQARAHELLALGMAEDGADVEAQLEVLKRCVQLDASRMSCRESHAALAKQFEAPRCSGADVRPTLRMFGATEAEEGTGEQLKDVDTPLRLETEPSLTERDVAEVSVIAQDEALLAGVEMRLTPSATQKLRSVTQRLASVGGWIVVKLAEEVILSAQVTEEIPFGRVRITTGTSTTPDALLERLCKQTARRQLPERLDL